MPISRPSPRTSVTRCGQIAYLRAKFACALDQSFAFDGADGRGDRGGCERVPRERRGVQQRVGVQRREQLIGRDNAADWHYAAAEDLAREHHVGGDTGEVSAPPGAKPTHAGLDLIQDQHGTGLGACLPDLPKVAVGRQADTPLGLDGFQQYHRISRQHGLQRDEIAERHEVNHWQQRAERVTILRPPGHR